MSVTLSAMVTGEKYEQWATGWCGFFYLKVDVSAN